MPKPPFIQSYFRDLTLALLADEAPTFSTISARLAPENYKQVLPITIAKAGNYRIRQVTEK